MDSNAGLHLPEPPKSPVREFQHIYDWLKYVPTWIDDYDPVHGLDSSHWCLDPIGRRCCCICALCLPVDFLVERDLTKRDVSHKFAVLHRMTMADATVPDDLKAFIHDEYAKMYERVCKKRWRQ